jgi:hypothetical protein
MNNKYFFVFPLLLLACFTLDAQDTLQLTIPEVVAPAGASPICLPIVADTFPDIVTAGFSLRWDSTRLRFDEVRFGDNPLNITGSSISRPDARSFVISWLADGLVGITLTEGTTIMELCFIPTMASGFSPITWQGINPNEFVQDGEITAFPARLIPGSVTYGGADPFNVLPGDTNNDAQVDHRDLINIGLINGTTGPARTNASTVFAPQPASIWSLSLNSGVNYARVDASGNGIIDATDAAVVAGNYGRAIGTFTTAPDQGAAIGPALSLSFDEEIRQEVATTVKIILGDGNDPNAVGYAIAFTVTFDPTIVDVNSLSVDFSDAFLGEDLYTLGRVRQAAPGRLEIALTRKDQVNTTTPGGEVCAITFTPLNPNNAATYPLEIGLVANTLVRANQTTSDLVGGNARLTIMGATAVTEPGWGAELRVFPNPSTNGLLSIDGETPAFDAVRILDQHGRLLRSFAGDVRQIDLTGLPAGTYLLQVEIRGERVNRRVVKR